MIDYSQTRFGKRLVDALYTEAMLLADEARSYFERAGRDHRDTLPALARVGFSCESLRITTRLMHVIAWLLTQRALEAGEITPARASARDRQLGHAPASDPAMIAALPEAARHLVEASVELYDRVRRLDDELERPDATPSPVNDLLTRLARAF